MPKLFTSTLFTFLILTTSSIANEIYSWQDKNGSTVYSTQPNPNAKNNQIINAEGSLRSNTTHKSPKDVESTAQKNKIANLNFLYPTNNQTIQYPGNKITLIVKNLSSIDNKSIKNLNLMINSKKVTPLSVYQDMIDILTPGPGKQTLTLSFNNKKGIKPVSVSFFIQPNRNREQIGTIPTDSSRYEASTGSNSGIENNMTKFYNDNKTSLIRPQPPQAVQGNWNAYKKQVNPN